MQQKFFMHQNLILDSPVVGSFSLKIQEQDLIKNIALLPFKLDD